MKTNRGFPFIVKGLETIQIVLGNVYFGPQEYNIKAFKTLELLKIDPIRMKNEKHANSIE